MKPSEQERLEDLEFSKHQRNSGVRKPVNADQRRAIRARLEQRHWDDQFELIRRRWG